MHAFYCAGGCCDSFLIKQNIIKWYTNVTIQFFKSNDNKCMVGIGLYWNI